MKSQVRILLEVFQLKTIQRFIAELFIVTFHHIEIIYVERVAKHQIVTPLSHGRMEGGGEKLGGESISGFSRTRVNFGTDRRFLVAPQLTQSRQNLLLISIN